MSHCGALRLASIWSSKDTGTATKLIKQLKSPAAKKGLAAEFETPLEVNNAPSFSFWVVNRTFLPDPPMQLC